MRSSCALVKKEAHESELLADKLRKEENEEGRECFPFFFLLSVCKRFLARLHCAFSALWARRIWSQVPGELGVGQPGHLQLWAQSLRTPMIPGQPQSCGVA